MTEDNTRFRGSTRQSYGSAGSQEMIGAARKGADEERQRTGQRGQESNSADRGYLLSRDAQSQTHRVGRILHVHHDRNQKHNYLIMSRMTTAGRTGSRVVASAKQDMKHSDARRYVLNLPSTKGWPNPIL